MMVKTSELTGVTLDWVVAKCEGYNYYAPKNHNYSTCWNKGGVIIEREINKIWKNIGGTYGAQIKYRVPYYSPTYDADIGADAYINKHGNTPLEAAMRCYVASKLGDEVEVPNELTEEI